MIISICNIRTMEVGSEVGFGGAFLGYRDNESRPKIKSKTLSTSEQTNKETRVGTDKTAQVKGPSIKSESLNWVIRTHMVHTDVHKLYSDVYV